MKGQDQDSVPAEGKIQRMLRAWARILIGRRNLVLWVTLGLVVAAGILTGTRLVIRNSTLDLIRKDSPVFKKYLAYMEEFDVRDEVLSRHAANLSARSTSRPTISANRTGTAFPNCRIVSDHEPWNT
jgi:predicted RND superfamily exporter protein